MEWRNNTKRKEAKKTEEERWGTTGVMLLNTSGVEFNQAIYSKTGQFMSVVSLQFIYWKKNHTKLATRWVFILQIQSMSTNSLPHFSKLGELLFGEIRKLRLIFQKQSHMRLQENKKFSLASHLPFLSDYDEIAGSNWCKRGLQPSSGTFHKKGTPAFIKMLTWSESKLILGRKTFPNPCRMFHFTEIKKFHVCWTWAKLILLLNYLFSSSSPPAENWTHYITLLPHNQPCSHSQPEWWHWLLFGWKNVMAFGCLQWPQKKLGKKKSYSSNE